MSIDIMNRIWWRDDLPTMEKFVALALANMAGDDDAACYPAVDTLARICGCVPRTIQNCTKRLESKGLLKIYTRKDRSNYYVFNMANLPIVSRPMRGRKERRIMVDIDMEPDLFAENERVQQIHPTPEPPSGTGESGSGTGAFNSATGAGDSPINHIEPSRETTEESGVEPPGVDIVVSLSDFIKTEWDKLKADFPNMGECRKVLPTQLELAKERARQHALEGQSDIDVWTEAFEKIRRSRFQTGRVAPTKGRNRYKLTLSELLKTHIFRETMNGKYISTDADEGSYDRSTGEILGPAAAAIGGTIERFRNARQRGGAGGNQG